MRFSFRSFLFLTFTFSLAVPASALYLQKFRYDFSDVHQVYAGFANDDFSFKFSNAGDDFRSTTIPFTYIAPKAFPLSVEATYNIFTFRGLKNTPTARQQRAGVLDLTTLYHWFLPMGEHAFEFQGGLRWTIVGNLGEGPAQKLAHSIFGYPKSIDFRETPFLGIAYLAGGAEYRWRNSLFTNVHLQSSFMGDVFFRTAFGIELRNDHMRLETSIWAQEIHWQDRGVDYSVLSTTAQAESGLGLFFKTESDHAFAFLDLKLWNWHPILQNGKDYGQNFGISGFGLRFTSDSRPKDERETPDVPVLTGDQWLADSLGWRFGVELPSSYTHSFVWVPRPHIPLSLVTGFSFSGSSMDNTLQALVSWDIWQIKFFGIFFETGVSVTFGVLSPYILDTWNRDVEGVDVGLGLDAKGGIWFRVFQTRSADYRLLLHAGFTYKPLYWEKAWDKAGTYRENVFNYYYAGFGLEVRPGGKRLG